VKLQHELGSDIMMVLDECLKYPCPKDKAEQSLELTNDWARRSKQEFQKQATSDKRQGARIKPIEESIKKARARGYKNIEIEVENIKELQAALASGAEYYNAG